MKRIVDENLRNDKTLLVKINMNDYNNLRIICEKYNMSETKVIKLLINNENDKEILPDELLISMLEKRLKEKD